MRARRELLIGLLVVLAGCSTRERANPFDPQNPNTSGRPVGFVALAGEGRATLRWDPASAQDLIGFQVFRKLPTETDYRAVTSVLDLHTTGYNDVGLANGVDHSYRLFYVFSDGLGSHPAEDVATPGSARPWVVDASRGTLNQLTPDARHIALQRSGFSSPTTVAVDPYTGRVWMSDDLAGKVFTLDPVSGSSVTIPDFFEPGAIAVYPSDHSAWVCDERRDQVDHLTPLGDPATLPIAPLELPLSVAVDSLDGSVMICEREGNRLRRHNSHGALTWTAVIDRPSRVAWDPVPREAWVTSFEAGKVSHVALDGQVIVTFPNFSGPIGIAVDSDRGRIWVAEALADRLTALDRDGNVEFRVEGLSEVRDVSVDPTTGEAWVVAPGTGEVVRISPTGAVLRRLGGFSLPYGVAIDPGLPYRRTAALAEADAPAWRTRTR
jgi:DNA-binding beta-propeller fold protein YncE